MLAGLIALVRDCVPYLNWEDLASFKMTSVYLLSLTNLCMPKLMFACFSLMVCWSRPAHGLPGYLEQRERKGNTPGLLYKLAAAAVATIKLFWTSISGSWDPRNDIGLLLLENKDGKMEIKYKNPIISFPYSLCN